MRQEHVPPLTPGHDPAERAEGEQHHVADAGDPGHGEAAEVRHLAAEPVDDS